jgi:hypothetical protein
MLRVLCRGAQRPGARRDTEGYMRLVTISLTAYLVLAALPVTAGVTCSAIDNPDQRAYCRALQTRSAGDCIAISDYALRQTCRARLASPGTGASQCNTITDQGQRQKCKDEAAHK